MASANPLAAITYLANLRRLGNRTCLPEQGSQMTHLLKPRFTERVLLYPIIPGGSEECVCRTSELKAVVEASTTIGRRLPRTVAPPGLAGVDGQVRLRRGHSAPGLGLSTDPRPVAILPPSPRRQDAGCRGGHPVRSGAKVRESCESLLDQR